MAAANEISASGSEVSHPFRLQRIALRYFKSVEYADVALRPLSVIVGANSAGKSTLLQALGAAVQTVRTGTDPGALVLNGELSRLGTYADIRNFRLVEKDDPIMIGFRLSIPGNLDRKTDEDVDFSSITMDSILDCAVFVSQGTSETDRGAHIEAGSLSFSTDGIHHEWLLWQPYNQLDRDEKPPQAWIDEYERVEREQISRIFTTRTAFKCVYMTTRDPQGIDSAQNLIEAYRFQCLDLNQPVDLIGRNSDPGEAHDNEHLNSRDSNSYTTFLRNVVDSDRTPLGWMNAVSRGWFKSKVSYLGPLRASPLERRSSYPRSGKGGLGMRGENLAEVLKLRGSTMARVPMPDGHVRLVRMEEAFNCWLRWFGFVDSAITRSGGRHGPDLRVVPPGASKSVELASVGAGVSQVLPVILQCLLSDPADLLIIEQPELHLHPALQKRMADFLLAFVRSGRQILVETHSDHFVNRLRAQVAWDQTDEIKNLVKLLFAEQTDGITSYREAEINEYGGLSEDWPDGFLDISAKSAQDLVRHGLQKFKQRHPRPADAN